jgi:peptidoglycan hydrolase-like protein with peptidoglycan-binding domain
VIQQKLGLTVDCDFGGQTAQAVRDWQTERGDIAVTGQVGPEDWALLDIPIMWGNDANEDGAIAPSEVAIDCAEPVFAPLATATTLPPVTAADNDHLFTVGQVVVPPGEPGQLSVALTGSDDGSSVPMIVRNNTDAPLSSVDVTGVARDASGNLVATGASQGFAPDRLEPGDWGIGYVYFDIDALSGDETFEFTAVGEPSDESFIDRVPLTITEAAVQPGDFSDRVAGIATNDTAEAATLGEIYVACFDGGVLVGVATGFTDVDEVPPGGIAPFTVDLYDFESCPSMALAGGGWSL